MTLPRRGGGPLGSWTPSQWPTVHKVEVDGVLVEPGIEPGSVRLRIERKSTLLYRHDVVRLVEAIREVSGAF